MMQVVSVIGEEGSAEGWKAEVTPEKSSAANEIICKHTKSE